MKRLQALTLLAFTVLGCSQEKNALVVEYSNMQERQTGHMVQVSPEQADILKQRFSGSVREINSAHGIYEVLGSSASEITAAVPDAEVHRNIVFNDIFPSSVKAAFEQLTQARRLDQPGALNSENLGPCVRDTETPSAKIELLNRDELKTAGNTVQRGQVLRLSARQSEAHPSHPGKLKFGWLIAFPNAKEPEGPFSSEAEFDVELTELGIYGIGLIAQDSRGVCSLHVSQVGVTDNPKRLSKTHTLQPLDKLDVDFGHLQTLEVNRAWKVTQGKGQVIAIIDTGVNYNHPYLAQNIFVNEKEKPDNNVDDDGNGFVDDAFGWDFIQQDGRPYDDAGHGSHVAGLAAGKVFGVAHDARILPVKAIGVDGAADMALVVSAIMYAVDSGATVINLSLGGSMPGEAPEEEIGPIRKAFDYAKSKNVVIVTAAGNGTRSPNGLPVRIDNDVVPHYPSGLNFVNNISVAATDLSGSLAPYSNYGYKTVKVAAPGGVPNSPIFSCKQDNTKGELWWGAEGTSMAAPIVAGTIALLRSMKPSLSFEAINDLLLTSGRQLSGLKGKIKSERLLNAGELIAKAQGSGARVAPLARKVKPKPTTVSSL